MNAFKRQGNEARQELILLAEDHPLNQKVALLLLGRMGYQAHVAVDGAQAVDAAKRQEYGAILMDCHMPEMDGFDATRAIRKHEASKGSHVPIIAVTALAMAGDRERCLAAGMDDYITKPIDRDLLEEKLNYWLNPGTISAMQHGSKVIPMFENAFSLAENGEQPINLTQFEDAYGDESQELLLLFVNSSDKLMRDLREALNEEADLGKVDRLSHEVKGASWAVGADEMARLSVFLEQAAGQQNWRMVQRTFLRLDHHFNDLRSFIESKLATEISS